MISRCWFKAVRHHIATTFLLLVVACNGSDSATPPPPPTIAPVSLLNVGISDNAALLAQKWATAYDAETDQAAVNFVTGNNAALFADLNAGQLDAILVHHIPEGDGDRWFNPVALDGLVIVVHAQNSVASLTQAQVQSLFSGEIGSWAAVDGAELAVIPFAQERGDGARTLFTRRIMGTRPVSINTVIQSDSAALLEAIAAQPGAIGYTMMSALDSAALSEVKVVSIDNIAPSPQSSASQDYPLTVPLYFVSPSEPQGEMRAFLAWLQSEEGQAIVSESVGSVR